jgi:hypothetical protein
MFSVQPLNLVPTAARLRRDADNGWNGFSVGEDTRTKAMIAIPDIPVPIDFHNDNRVSYGLIQHVGETLRITVLCPHFNLVSHPFGALGGVEPLVVHKSRVIGFVVPIVLGRRTTRRRTIPLLVFPRRSVAEESIVALFFYNINDIAHCNRSMEVQLFSRSAPHT